MYDTEGGLLKVKHMMRKADCGKKHMMRKGAGSKEKNFEGRRNYE